MEGNWGGFLALSGLFRNTSCLRAMFCCTLILPAMSWMFSKDHLGMAQNKRLKGECGTGMGRLAGSSQGPWDSPAVGSCPQTWVRGMLRVGAPGWLRMHTQALTQHPAQWMAVLCLSSSAHSVPAPSLPPDWHLQTSVSSGWDPDVPTWIRSPGHKGSLCLYSGSVFITDVPWIKDTASTWEGVIQTELIVAVNTYKYSCVCSVKKAKQIKYFWSCSIACRLLTRHRSQNSSDLGFISLAQATLSNLSGSAQHS